MIRIPIIIRDSTHPYHPLLTEQWHTARARLFRGMRTRSGYPSGHVTVLLIFAFSLITSCMPLDTGVVFSPPGTTTTIILVRHAERDEGLDPPLNAEGLIRAEALADQLQDAGVTAIFYPDLIRNRQTAEPLVNRVDPIVRVYNQIEAADTKALANGFVDEVLADHAGGVVLWIGNTGPAIENVQEGNLQEIYARLGGTGNPPIRYQSLYTIVLHDDSPPTLTMATYGGVSSLD